MFRVEEVQEDSCGSKVGSTDIIALQVALDNFFSEEDNPLGSSISDSVFSVLLSCVANMGTESEHLQPFSDVV